jgi:hypothetical protein
MTLKNLKMTSYGWQFLPRMLSALQSLEIRYASLDYRSWVDKLEEQAATSNLTELVIDDSRIEDFYSLCGDLARLTGLRTLKLHPDGPSEWGYPTDFSAFKAIVNLSIPIGSIAEHSYLKTLPFLTRLCASANCDQPTFHLFDIPNSLEFSQDLNKTARLRVEKMSSYLPDHFKPWNFFLRHHRFEYNLLTRAICLGHTPFLKALMNEVPQWNLEAACSRSGRTALLWAFESRVGSTLVIDYATYLLEMGANPVIVDRFSGMAPLHYAFRLQNTNLMDRILDMALDRDPNVSYSIAGALGGEGFTAVGAAYSVAQPLIPWTWLTEQYEHGKIKDLHFSALTPFKRGGRIRKPFFLFLSQVLDFATWLPLFEKYKHLVDVDVRDPSGRTFLHLIAGPNAAEVVKIFWARSKLSIDDIDHNGFSGVLYAAQSQSEKLFFFFVRRGADARRAVQWIRTPDDRWTPFIGSLADYVSVSEKWVPWADALMSSVSMLEYSDGFIAWYRGVVQANNDKKLLNAT